MIFTLVPNKTFTLVTSAGEVLAPIPASHPNWAKIMDALKRRNEAEIVSLMSVKQAVIDFGNNLSYKGNIEVNGNQVFYRGEQLFGEDVTRILGFLADGIPAEGMIQFLERKLGNPSFRSIQSMYSFLENGSMPITPNGCFLGYKGVKADFSSKNTGSEPLLKGKRLPNGSIDNSIGEEILIERRYVCDDFNQACAPGLHVGSLEYAKGWAGPEGKVVIVEVDPALVVTVPVDETAKLRCCGYKVIGEYVRKMDEVFTSEYNNDTTSNDDECSDCGNQDCNCDNDNCPDCGFYNDCCECEKCPNCGERVGECICSCKEIRDEVATLKENTPPAVETEYQKGVTLGLKHGKGHVKRLYSVEDETNTRRKNTDFIVGYNQGYRDARVDK